MQFFPAFKRKIVFLIIRDAPAASDVGYFNQLKLTGYTWEACLCHIINIL